MSATNAPEILWAQRSSAEEPEKNVVMLTINVPNLTEDSVKVDLTASHLHFEASVPADSAKGIEGKHYLFDVDFFEEIDVAQSKQHLTPKSLYMLLRKQQSKDEYWPRLTKEKVRLHNVKTDFSKWVDEDEQDGEQPDDVGGMGGMPDMGGMGGMGGMPGMGGMGGMPGMGGAGGAGGMGGLDLQQLMASMGGGADGAGMPDMSAFAGDGADMDAGEEDGEEPAIEEVEEPTK
ncbi:p23 chaperone protein wos2 [Malassezia vespertilionis]|uniref:CS domain-containing protein n=1 Tax=Malassezia vespertilionis TaxID=2020962 RepID=A0A2N1JDD0_9BASI|nr:p23 chaperone protein wos2 [Malassezia vespertilionis]PKI84547.1 hypothetical protein MVES_001418 [Malassezia vespertilionis]WFD06163.1 p23 chaperone protein wos2 [Malassezia vespertilionis]